MNGTRRRLACACLCLGLGCARVEERPAVRQPPGPREPDQVAWGWTSTVTRGGLRRAVISAGRYRHFDPIRTDSLDQGVEVAFFDAAGKRVSLLRCRVGVVTQRDRNTLALGSVVVTATDSTILETEALRWENESERIYGDGPVTIRRPDGLETGIGFESSPDLKRWSMRDVITRKRR